MRTICLLIALCTLAVTARADEKESGSLALEPYFAFGYFGDTEHTVTGENPWKRDLDTYTETLSAGLKFIVPTSERTSIRGQFAYAHLKDEINFTNLPEGYTPAEEKTTRDGFVGEVSLRVWFGKRSE